MGESTSVFKNGQFWKPLAIGLGSLVSVAAAAWILMLQIAASHITREEMIEQMDREHAPIVEVMREQKAIIEDVRDDIQDMKVEQGKIAVKLRIPRDQ